MFDDRVLVPPHLVERAPVHQGHYVPQHGYYPNFGFDVATRPEIVAEYQADEHPPGATAQNGMREVIYYRCNGCELVVREEDIPTHHCEVSDGA